MRQYTDFNSLVVSGGNIAAAATASVGSSSSITPSTDAVAAEINAQLAAMPGVGRVETGGMRALFPQPSTGMIIAPPSISPPSDSIEGNSTAEDAALCSESDGKLGPDADLGRRSEGIPYGIKLVQADDPAMVELSRKYRSKVLFCVIDTGLDHTNKEFNNASEWLPWNGQQTASLPQSSSSSSRGGDSSGSSICDRFICMHVANSCKRLVIAAAASSSSAAAVYSGRAYSGPAYSGPACSCLHSSRQY
jgi:hypothetical protein